MADVDLAKVNISLQQFQSISSGTHNAGEVSLASETTLGKINNHVFLTGRNGRRQSHAEIYAIKQALVKALSANGVGQEELARIKKELGLAIDGENDLSLRQRSVKPLTRQQVREILDRNAGAINTHNAGAQGGTHIRTSREIYGAQGMGQARAARRDAVNATLDAGGRLLRENETISLLSALAAGDVDFRTHEEKEKILALAIEKLDNLMVKCSLHPREDENVALSTILSNGQKVRIETGMSEKALARRLEDIIIRLRAIGGPSAANAEVRQAFAQMTPGGKGMWLAALGPERENSGRDARIVAVLLMQKLGVAKAETFEVVNRISDKDAIILARRLAEKDEGIGEEAVLRDPVVRAMMEKEPVEVEMHDKAGIPATSVSAYNHAVIESFGNNTDLAFPEFAALLSQAGDEMRSRYGEDGLPDGTSRRSYVNTTDLYNAVRPDEPDTVRVTPESLRATVLDSAAETAARRITAKRFAAELKALPWGKEKDAFGVTNMFMAANPVFLAKMKAVRNPAEADAIMAEYAEEIKKQAWKHVECKQAAENALPRARIAFAEGLGLPPECIRQESIQLNYLVRKTKELTSDILMGKRKVDTALDIDNAFRELTNGFVRERLDKLDQIDKLDLPRQVKDAMKDNLLLVEKSKDANIALIAREAEKIDMGALDALLRANAPKAQIYAEMGRLTQKINKPLDMLFKGKNDVAQDDYLMPAFLIVFAAAGKVDGLFGRLQDFFDREDVRDENFSNEPTEQAPQGHAKYFLGLQRFPGANGALAEDIAAGRAGVLHTLALVEAGGERDADETLALFAPGTAANSALVAAINASEEEVTPEKLRALAAGALKAR